MSHHYSGPNLAFPRGDARLDFTDLYAFPKPGEWSIPCAKSSKNSKANRIETGEKSGGIGEICSVEVEEK